MHKAVSPIILFIITLYMGALTPDMAFAKKAPYQMGPVLAPGTISKAYESLFPAPLGGSLATGCTNKDDNGGIINSDIAWAECLKRAKWLCANRFNGGAEAASAYYESTETHTVLIYVYAFQPAPGSDITQPSGAAPIGEMIVEFPCP